jgi:hypothetical protein
LTLSCPAGRGVSANRLCLPLNDTFLPRTTPKDGLRLRTLRLDLLQSGDNRRESVIDNATDATAAATTYAVRPSKATTLPHRPQQHRVPVEVQKPPLALGESTLERLAYAAKDALLVVDDFAPAGVGDGLLESVTERLFRGVGNAQARSRLGGDGRLQTQQAPRGLVLGTGEAVPPGQSIRARLLIVEMDAGAVRRTALNAGQSAGREGLLAAAMGAFVVWLAGTYEAMQNRLQQRVQVLRSQGLFFCLLSFFRRVRRELLLAFGLGFGLRAFAVLLSPAGRRNGAVREKPAWRAACQPKQYLGHLSSHDPLHPYLVHDVLPQMGVGNNGGPTFASFSMKDSKVYLYEERHSCAQVVGKFFVSGGHHIGPGADERMRQEFDNLQLLRGYGLAGYPHHVVRPLGTNAWLNSILVEEYAEGSPAKRFRQRAIHQGQSQPLFEKLTALAYFLATLHNRTANGLRVDFNQDCAYLDRLVRKLQSQAGDRRLGRGRIVLVARPLARKAAHVGG